MLIKLHFFRILVGILLVSFFSCKKDKDNQLPTVIVTSPSDNAVFSVNDPIEVKAQISDNNIIESVEVTINRLSDKAKVSQSIYLNVGSKSYALDLFYNIQDSLLPTGEYYLTISAYDGENIGTAFQEIKIIGLNKKLLNSIAVTSDGIGSSLVDISNNTNPIIWSFNSDFGGAAISNREQTIYFCGKKDDQLIAYNLKSNSIIWSKTYLSQPTAIVFNYLDLDASGQNVGISLNSSFVDVVTSTGSAEQKFELKTGQIPQRHFLKEKLSFVESMSVNNSIHQLEVFHSSTSGIFDSKHIDFFIVEIVEMQAESAFIFANKQGESYLYEYNYSSSSMRTVDKLANDSLLQVIQVNKDSYIISGKKHIYTYQLSSGSTFEQIQGVQANSMAYDPISGELYTSQGNTYTVYNYSNAGIKRSGTLNSEIKKILLRYNF